jgi:hypothetical protein
MDTVVKFLVQELATLNPSTVRSILGSVTSVYYGPCVAVACAKCFNLFSPLVEGLIEKYEVSRENSAYPALLFEAPSDGSRDVDIVTTLIRTSLHQKVSQNEAAIPAAIGFLRDVDGITYLHSDGCTRDFVLLLLSHNESTTIWCDEFLLNDQTVTTAASSYMVEV